MEGVKRKRRGCRAVRKRKGRWGKKERGASRKEGKASRQGKEKKKLTDHLIFFFFLAFKPLDNHCNRYIKKLSKF